MDIKSQFDEQGYCRTFLDGDLSIYHVADIMPSLLEAMKRSTEMELHLGAVSEIDTAGLQLLVLLEKEAEREGKPFRLSDHSLAVVEMMQLFDLTGYFGDPVLIQSTLS